MKYSKKALAILLSAFLLGTSATIGVFAKSDKQQDAVSSDCNILATFTDPQVMATKMANPAEFMQLMTLINNPQTTQEIMECSSDLQQWNAWIANMSNPTKMMNAFAQFMNPQMYVNWMAASMNPQTYQPMYAYMNPAFYAQWMTATANPSFYQPMYKMMDPSWQQESVAWMMNPNSYQQMFESLYQTPATGNATEEATKE